MVASPNGSGRSTLTRPKRCGEALVIDPDAIARRIDRDATRSRVLAAGRKAMRIRRAAVANAYSLVVESSSAGKTMLRFMEQARRVGYGIELRYVSVNSPSQALDRISDRVALGIHDVLETDVKRGFARSQAKLPAATTVADESRTYDNSSPDEPYREVAILTSDRLWLTENPPSWVAVGLSGLALPQLHSDLVTRQQGLVYDSTWSPLAAGRDEESVIIVLRGPGAVATVCSSSQ